MNTKSTESVQKGKTGLISIIRGGLGRTLLLWFLGISLIRPDWIDFNNETLTAKVAALPAPGSVPFPVDVSSVIEYYAQRL